MNFMQKCRLDLKAYNRQKRRQLRDREADLKLQDQITLMIEQAPLAPAITHQMRAIGAACCGLHLMCIFAQTKPRRARIRR